MRACFRKDTDRSQTIGLHGDPDPPGRCRRMKERIRRFVSELEIDDVGFAAASDYRSPLSPHLETFFPGARSIVVLAYKELDSCDSPDLHIAMNGRMDLMEFARSCNYKLARHLERSFGASAMTVPASYPMVQNEETKGAVGQVSLRHAAAAAGLGAFGSNNLVIPVSYTH